MPENSLIQALPDLTAFVRRDGWVLKQIGGRCMEVPGGLLEGRSIADVWSPEIGARLLQAVQRTLKDRRPSTARFCWQERHYEARVHAHARDRAVCVIRESPGVGGVDATEGVRGAGAAASARREFFDSLKSKVADATLRQTALALCLIHLDGLDAVGHAFDFSLVDDLLRQLVTRFSTTGAREGGDQWTVSVIGEDLLALILERHADRDAVRAAAARLQESLAAPLAVNANTFTFTPRCGIAILGEDATRARPLAEHAHAAMVQARRGTAQGIVFYSDTLRLRSLARLDIEQELRAAIAADQLALRYLGRHDLQSGALVGVQAYMTWPHSMRGEVRAADFLPVADNTGLSLLLSRWALRRLCSDWPMLLTLGNPGLKVSFGALRHHLADSQLAQDVRDCFAKGELQPQSLELRVAEKALSGLAAVSTTLRGLAELGVSLVIDEFGRGSVSLPKLARLPIHALQLDRALVLSAATDPVARKAVCAAVAMSTALELRPVASGIDTPQQRDWLRSLGCREGLGDCFPMLQLPGRVRTEADPDLLIRDSRKRRI